MSSRNLCVVRYVLPDIAVVGQRNQPTASCRGALGLRVAVGTIDCHVWSLTSLKQKLIKIGAKVVCHGRYFAFQMAEVAIPRELFADILRLIAELRPPPDPAPA